MDSLDRVPLLPTGYGSFVRTVLRFGESLISGCSCDLCHMRQSYQSDLLGFNDRDTGLRNATDERTQTGFIV